MEKPIEKINPFKKVVLDLTQEKEKYKMKQTFADFSLISKINEIIDRLNKISL